MFLEDVQLHVAALYSIESSAITSSDAAFCDQYSLTGWRRVITPHACGRVKQLGLSVYLSVCVCLSVQQSHLQEEVIAKPNSRDLVSVIM